MTEPRPLASAGPGGRRGGFTMVELVVVAAVVSILARIALPNLQEAVVRARAAAALGDVEVVRAAALEFNAESHTWPQDAPVGEVPEALLPHLPDGFSFQREHYRLDWENWSLPDGLPGSPGTGVLLGVAVSTDETLMGNAIADLLGGNGWYTLGNSYTFLITGG